MLSTFSVNMASTLGAGLRPPPSAGGSRSRRSGDRLRSGDRDRDRSGDRLRSDDRLRSGDRDRSWDRSWGIVVEIWGASKTDKP